MGRAFILVLLLTYVLFKAFVNFVILLVHPTTTHPSPDSLADSLEQGDIQNGDHSEAAREGKEAKQKGSQEGSSTVGPSRGRDEGGDRSQHRVQVGVCLSSGFLIASYQYILKGHHWNPTL